MNAPVDLRELAIDRGGADAPKTPMRRHALTRYVLPLALLCAVASLAAWAARDLVFPPTRVTVVPVFSTTAEVQQSGAPLFKAAGWIEPRPTPIRVAALAPGVVAQLLVVEDQAVAVGEPIAQLIREDAELTYRQTLADLELRNAELDVATAALVAAKTRFEQPVHLEAALGESNATLAKIETELRNLPFEIRRAEADYRAMQQDYQGKAAAPGVVAGVAIDVAKSKLEAAEALVEELRNRATSLDKEQAALIQRRDALKTQLKLLADEIEDKNESEAKVKSAMARVEQAEVVVAEAKLRLDRMTIRSPIDGRVFRLIAHPGARIGGMEQMTGYDGSTVVTLYRPESLQIRVDVRFEDIPKVALGQPVEIDNPALRSPLTGSVLFVSSEADIQKNTLQVKVAIPDPPAVFKPEMLVDVTFLAPKRTERAPEASHELKLYAPRQLIRQDDGGSYVWLADQSAGVARKTKVELGTAQANGLMEIASGLTVSSRIISSGADQLRDGIRIKIAGEDPTLGVSNGVSSRTDDSTEKGNRPRTTNRLPEGIKP